MKFLAKKHVVSSFVTVLALFAASFMGMAPVGAADHGQNTKGTGSVKKKQKSCKALAYSLSLIHISEPTRPY